MPIMKARFAFVLLAVTFIMLGTAFAAEGDRVDARFEIYGFAGFHVLTNRTSVQESGERYAIAMDLDTRGLGRQAWCQPRQFAVSSALRGG